MIKVIDEYDRRNLSEGRDKGMGFAFCHKPENDIAKTVHAISACKDYLNDIVFTEHTKKTMSAYGLTTTVGNIFKGTDKAYIAIKILARQNGDRYSTQDDDEKNLSDNYQNIYKFLNFFEDKLGIERSLIAPTQDPDTFLIEFSQAWSSYTYSISLFSLLTRLGQFYKGGDELKFVESYNSFQEDVYLAKQVYPKIVKLLDMGGLVKQDLSVMEPNTKTHNFGIAAMQI